MFYVWDAGIKKPHYKYALIKYVNDTRRIVKACSSLYTNESLNASIAHLAPKLFDFRASYNARVALVASSSSVVAQMKMFIYLLKRQLNVVPHFAFLAITLASFL